MIEKFSDAEIRHSNSVGLPKIMNKINEIIELLNALLSSHTPAKVKGVDK